MNFIANSSLMQQLALMGVEALLVASLLLTMFRLRNVFGLAPIYMTLGVLSQVAALLSASVYVKFGPHLTMGPGSIVLFPAVLFAVLFLYIREDANAARQSIYALVASNAVIALLALLASLHLRSSMVVNPLGVPVELFIQQPRIMIVGTITLLADTILTILLYEWLGRFFSRHLFVRVYLSLALVLLFDTVCFTTGCFYESPDYPSIILSDVIGKSVAAILYAALLTTYLRYFDVEQDVPAESQGRLRDFFHVLTYREKYEALRLQSGIDALTAVHNRGYFDGALASHVAEARRTGRPLTLMLIDVDHFKEINDTRGHAQGDRALTTIAAAIRQTVRACDVVARYGGEEFALLLPDTAAAQAESMAERIRAAVPAACRQTGAGSASRPTTVTIGVATTAGETLDTENLLRLADEHLYAGKRGGRDRVVTSLSIQQQTGRRYLAAARG